jgi:hypothetical protein
MPHRSQSHPASLGLIFGPQAMSFDLNTFTTLRTKLVENRRGQWAIDAIAALPAQWTAVSGNITILKQYDAGKFLQNLNEWLKTGRVPLTEIPFRNVLLAPLVVTDHLTSYLEFLQSAFPDLSDDQELPASAKDSLETLGLSLGTLSAFAVSSSSTVSEVKKHGAIAITLAMLVGAVGDAEDLSRVPEERALSFSAFWKSTELHDLLHDSLNAIPEVRIRLI